MTEIYAVNCSPLLDDEKLESIYSMLDARRQNRLAGLAEPKKKAQRAAAGWLLTTLLGCDGLPPALFHGSRGKPYLLDREDRFFNLSHTGSWVFCAVSEDEVGIDAQVQQNANLRVAQRCFTEEELTWLQEDPDGRFARLWTLKEAYLKRTGFGLVLPMSSFTVPLPAGGWDETTQNNWKELTFSHSDTPIFLSVCAASKNPIGEIKILEIK